MMPNKFIAQGYESYVIETKSSGIVDGVLGPQSPTTITLRHEEDVIRREDIQPMRVSNSRQCPPIVKKQVSVEEMADLLQCIKSAH